MQVTPPPPPPPGAGWGAASQPTARPGSQNRGLAVPVVPVLGPGDGGDPPHCHMWADTRPEGTVVPGPGWSRAGSRTRPGGSHEDPVLLCPAGGQPCPLPTCLCGQRTEPPYLGWPRSSDCSKRPTRILHAHHVASRVGTEPAPSLRQPNQENPNRRPVLCPRGTLAGRRVARTEHSDPKLAWPQCGRAATDDPDAVAVPGAALATLETQSYSPATRHGPGTDAETWPRGALTELRGGRAGPPRPPPSDSASRVLGVTEVDAGVAWRTGSGTPQPQLRKSTARTSPGAGTFPSSRGPRLRGRTCPSAPTDAHRGFCVSSSPAVAPVALALPFPESGSVSRPPLTGRQGAGPNLTGAAGPRPLGLPEASR